jgi:hypothetical protein
VADINASIIDQQVRQLAGRLEFEGDEHKQRSTAFVLLCVKSWLDIDEDAALDCLTEGGQDAAMDAMHVRDPIDGEFEITLFQGKYKQRLDGASAFPGAEVGKLVGTIGRLFDPDKPFHANHKVTARVEEIRSLIRDGYLPHVRVLLCNNGKRWEVDGQAFIESSGFPPERVTWEHLNHDRLVELMQSPRAVSADLRLAGRIAVEEFSFRRVLIGKVPVSELAALFRQHGDRLLEKNIRRFIGENRINRDIARTLRSADARPNFYFFNNGVTMVCSKFRHNALQAENHFVRVDGLQVINGGQTCHAIRRVLDARPDDDFSHTYVLLRLYEIEDEQSDLIRDITYATNSQNPVDLRDLRSNDAVQRRLEMGLADLGVTYHRKRGMPRGKGENLDPATAAEAVLAIWRRKPHVARFDKNQHFGRWYAEIFTENLSPAQVIVAVEILRAVESRRKRAPADAPRFLPYASPFLAMLVGASLLERLQSDVQGLTHLVLDQAREHLQRFDVLYERALYQLRILLRLIGVPEEKSSLQKLSATFRRGDLLEALPDLHDKAIAEVQRRLEPWRTARPELRALFEKFDEIDAADGSMIDVRSAIPEIIGDIQQIDPELAALCRQICLQEFDEDLISWVERAFEQSFERPSAEERFAMEIIGSNLILHDAFKRHLSGMKRKRLNDDVV